MNLSYLILNIPNILFQNSCEARLTIIYRYLMLQDMLLPLFNSLVSIPVIWNKDNYAAVFFVLEPIVCTASYDRIQNSGPVIFGLFC